jgi:hypothetical protein
MTRIRIPDEVLSAGNAVEAELGRVRDERWGPRTIDIDALPVSPARSDRRKADTRRDGPQSQGVAANRYRGAMPESHSHHWPPFSLQSSLLGRVQLAPR